VLGWRHIRHLPFFLMAAGAYWPVCLNVNVDYWRSHAGLKKLWPRKSLKFAVLGCLALVTLYNFFFFIADQPFSLQLPEKPIAQEDVNYLFYPVGAVNFIEKQGLSGKILSKFEWGEYLIWKLYPRCLVAFDGRYETVYPREVDQQYDALIYARPQWRLFLKTYPPDLILLDKRMPIVNLIRQEPHWRQIYADSGCVLFLAQTGK
jgi:hypothetical protein